VVTSALMTAGRCGVGMRIAQPELDSYGAAKRSTGGSTASVPRSTAAAAYPPGFGSPRPHDRMESRQTPTSDRAKDGKVRHQGQQTPASGDTNSRKGCKLLEFRVFSAPPLDQESPGSSPGGAMKPGNLELPGFSPICAASTVQAYTPT
jgi:hypothetical protein